ILNYASETGSLTFVSPQSPRSGDLFTPVVGPSTLTAQCVVNAADLAATAVFVPASATLGQTVSVGYAVQNTSSNATTITQWTDSLYLSLDATLDPSDVLLGRVDHNGTVNGNTSYTGTYTGPMPAVQPGLYHVIVVSDSRSFVPDTNRANNTLAST